MGVTCVINEPMVTKKKKLIKHLYLFLVTAKADEKCSLGRAVRECFVNHGKQ
ncbi:unnamed protein product, partial [Nesidiocoris tenuis]